MQIPLDQAEFLKLTEDEGHFKHDASIFVSLPRFEWDTRGKIGEDAAAVRGVLSARRGAHAVRPRIAEGHWLSHVL